MGKKILILFAVLTTFVIVAFGFIYLRPMYHFFQAAKKPRYEVGEHKGAQFCADCHQEIYDQWLQNSVHAEATTNTRFLDYKNKITSNFMLNAMMGEEFCYACHGSKEVNEGVNCETCHGTVIPNVSIEETHEKKFKPRRENLRKPDSCTKCHEMEDGMTTYREWQKSEAAKQGITCQGCHMKPRESGVPYHGFDSVSRTRNVGIYRDDLKIKDININFPQFSLAIENRVMGHAIPASGPSRVLVLEISFLDLKGVETYKIVQTFAKYFELIPIVGIFPAKLIENTQLQSGEARQLSFTLPSSLAGQISKAVLTLRFYDVSDDHAGDLNKAHWISEPILEGEVGI
ncbi:MAG: multiheme c-type cytochrome [bacterium]